MEFTNKAATSPTHKDQHLRDRTYRASPDTIVEALRSFANSHRRWRFTSYEQVKGIAHLEHDTPIITFTDDITLNLVQDGAQTRVSGRSAARVGSFDFGVNARNLRAILGALDAQLQHG
jgi:uncharacterized protein (DUF1499 family)